ncbi:MAG TPA: HNH endonuclease [Candidatus Acidoferrum sp.]|nr:HNH endonuclease [Candidatus Acidoferrum sp.]
MTNKASDAAPNAAEVWKQMEDILVPQLRLSVLDRSVFSHLLRHSRLEGKLRLRFSIQWLARAVRVSGGPAREAVRRLAALGALRLVERTKAGHLVEVRLPEEIRAACPGRSVPAKSRPGRGAIGVRRTSGTPDTQARALPLEDSDFLQTRALRQSIHSRERGLCFYCLRRLTPSQKCLDHVVPRVRFGRNSYRNLVSCCVECNSQKSERPAHDFLRCLYREQRLTTAELTDRLRALDALAAGKLRPLTAPACSRALPVPVPSGSRRQRVPVPAGGPANPFPRKGRPCKTAVF